MSLVDFLVIGAQNSELGPLVRILRGHPRLALGNVGDAPLRTRQRSFAEELSAYASAHLAHVKPGVLRGVLSTACMSGATGADRWGVPVEGLAEEIAQTVPQAKLIALLREPTQRAIAHHRMCRRQGLDDRPLARALREQLAAGALDAARVAPRQSSGYVVWGEYGRILSAYLKHVPADQVLIMLDSEFGANPAASKKRVFTFLGLSNSSRSRRSPALSDFDRSQGRISDSDQQSLLAALEPVVPQRYRSGVEAALTKWNVDDDGTTPELLEPALEEQLASHFSRDGLLLESFCGFEIPWAAPPQPGRAPHVASPEVSILVLAHGAVRETGELLGSLVAHTDGAYEILLLDNCSSARDAEMLARLAELHGARLIRFDANLTFSIANNMGLRLSSGGQVAFLNSDVLVTPNWLRNLRIALDSAPDVAIVGPRTNCSRAAQSGIWLDDTSNSGISEFGRFFNHSDPARWFEIDWLAGFAMLARRDVLTRIGGFDETLPWHGLEDRALCEALKAAGWRVLCAGDTFVYHAGHRTFNEAGINRTSSRFGRPAADAAQLATDTGRLVRDDDGLLFEVRDGVACQLEAPPGLIRAGRPIHAARKGELEQLSFGPPISIVRLRGTDEVYLSYWGTRRRIRGDQQRIRRLPWMSMIDPQEIEDLVAGPDVRVEDALPPVPEIEPRLPVNPARIHAKQLAPVERVLNKIAAALQAGRGYALIRLELDEILVLNQGIWPVGYPDSARAGIQQHPAVAAAMLRSAIIGADAVGVYEDRSQLTGAPLLESLLFHHDLYPRLRCSSRINQDLMGTAAASPLRDLLSGSRVALVCPSALVGWLRGRPEEHWRDQGFAVRLVTGLDDLRDVAGAVGLLGARRAEFDAVLVVGNVAAKPLCSRLARELDVVALDVGEAASRLLHPRYAGGTNPLVFLRAEVNRYLQQMRSDAPYPHSEFEGRLIRPRGGGAIYYVERGALREVLSPSLLRLFDHEPTEVEPGAITLMRRAMPLCAVHEPLTNHYVLLDGKKVPLDLGITTVVVDDLRLDAVPDDDRELNLAGE